MTRRHRYRQEAIPGTSGEAREYSPRVEGPPPPTQGHLALDGGFLGPLFNEPPEETEGLPLSCHPGNYWDPWGPEA